MRLLYFAWLRAKIGIAEERIDPAADIIDVAALLRWLRTRGPGYAEALQDLSVVRVAVNQEYVPTSHPLRPDDEIALFPPMTGG